MLDRTNPEGASDTVSSVVLKTLKKHGIRHVFGLPAAQLGLVMDGAARDPFFSYATTRHEEAAGHMAHAVAKVTGGMGVCFGTVGPGAMNLVPGVAAAWADNVPMLVLTPDNQLDMVDPGRDLLQSADQLGVYRAVTKWNAAIRQSERAAELVERAIHVARSGRPGPVHLNIPCDVGTWPCRFDPDRFPAIPVPRPAPGEDDFDRVVDALRSARRPVLIAGGGVARSDAVSEFRALVEQTGCIATTTLNARGTIAQDCPTHIGSGGVLAGTTAVKAFSEADLVLAVGCKFSSWVPVNKPPRFAMPAGQRIVQVDIDPAVLGRAAPCHVGVAADAREFLRVLNEALASSRLRIDQEWVAGIQADYRGYRRAVEELADAEYVQGTRRYNEAAAARAISRVLPRDAIVAFDGGQVMEWYHTFIHPASPRHCLFNPGMGHLGMGQPAANAASMIHPDRPVVCVTADGAMGCTIQELETAVRYGLQTITIVCNDAHWGMYRPLGDELFRNAEFGTRLTSTDFVAVARGFGCHGERVERLEDLPAAFERARAAGAPALIEIPVEFTPHPVDYFWPESVLRGMALAPVSP